MKKILSLHNFLKSLNARQRDLFAERCGTTFQHIRNIGYGDKPCSAELAIDIERESMGIVRCEELCQRADWEYIRHSLRKVA